MTDYIKLGPGKGVPVADYASQGNAILGIRGSGKSYTGTWVAEQLFDGGIPFCAFDPIGIWHNLRVAGSGPGIPVVVAGGAHGDLPLTPASAPEITRAAMNDRVSVVFDLYTMELSKADWRRIVETCVRTMLYENGRHGLRHIFLEEAAEFIPQKVGPDQAKVYAELEKLARMGGNAQLGYTLINQRSEEVSKAVLELADCLILHRQKGKNSLVNLAKWLDVAETVGAKAIMKSIPTMAAGECWVWTAGSDEPFHQRIPAKRSFHPDRKAMQRADSAQRPRVPVDTFVAHLQANISQLVEQRQADDPDTLRATIAELRRKLADNAPDLQDLMRERAAAAAHLRQDAELVLTPVLTSLRRSVEELSAWLNLPASTEEAAAEPVARAVEAERDPGAARALKHVREQSAMRVTVAAHLLGKAKDGTPLPKAERKILTALAQYPNGRTRTQVAVLTAYASSGGSFKNALGALRSAGRVEDHGELLRITAAGLQALGSYERLPTGRALLDHWCRQLGKAERLILEQLAQAYPHSLSRGDTAHRTNYEESGGSFKNALGRLRSLELITGSRDLKASAHLFGG